MSCRDFSATVARHSRENGFGAGGDADGRGFSELLSVGGLLATVVPFFFLFGEVDDVFFGAPSAMLFPFMIHLASSRQSTWLSVLTSLETAVVFPE